MITTKRPNTDDYTQVGFIEAKDNQGNYQNIDKIYDNQGNIVFQQGYLNEYQGADDFGIPAIGKPLIDYTIYGNTFQDGTPTPDNPVMPQGTGERTGNLANMYGINATGLNLTFKTDSNMTLKINGTKQDGVNIRDLAHPNIILPAGKYTAKIKMIGGSITNITGGVMFGINKSDYGMRTAPQVNTVGQVGTRTFTLNSDTLLTSLDITPSYGDVGAIFNDAVFQCWLYSGDGDVPYEPYGYKIPISSAGQTKTIYLGQVQTTRRIKKLVLTGEEYWTLQSINSYGIANLWTILPAKFRNQGVGLSTHLTLQTTLINDTETEGFYLTSSEVLYIRINTTRVSTVTDFKSYLAAQYAAGTPVTVWYVLATPEVGIVNEPLMKIDDYADSITFEQAGVEIPTLKKPNTTVIDVKTSLKPSEVDVTYRGSTKPQYDLFLAKNGESFEAKDGQSLYIGKGEKTTIYGWHVDPNISNSSDAITYLNDAVGMTPAHMGTSEFNYGSWKNAFFMPKPCMVNYDGTVAYYLDPNDYSKKSDGSPSDVGNPNFPGNAMMQWPLIWYKFEGGTEDGEGYFYVANRQVDDTYHCWCNVDSKNNIIPHFYTAIYNGTGTTKLRSISDVALTSANGNGGTTTTQEETRAKANNTTNDVEWYIDVWCDRLLINALLVLMGKSLNTQAVFGRGLDTGGQTAKEAYVTGTLNDKGLFWGDSANGTSAVKVFGMENWWACCWRRTAGCISVNRALKIKLTYGTADGSTVVGYNQTGNGYISNGTIPSTDNYVKAMTYNQYGNMTSNVTGGSSSTYYADFFYKNTNTRYLLVGDYSGDGVRAGAFSFTLNAAPSYALWQITAALSCKPLAQKG